MRTEDCVLRPLFHIPAFFDIKYTVDMEIERKKSKAESREFYKDYIYPQPAATTGTARAPKTGGARAMRQRNKIVLSVLTVIALLGALLLADFLADGAAIGLLKKNGDTIFLKSEDYFAAETGSFTFMSEARECAEATESAGGAGYIYNDGVFHVLASVHKKKAAAEASAKSFEGAAVLVFNIPAASVAFAGSKAERDALHEGAVMPLAVFSQLCDISEKLGAGNISAAQAYIRLQSAEEETKAALGRLEKINGGGSMPVTRIKAELTVIIAVISDLTGLAAEPAALVKKLNHSSVKILCSYKDTVSEL